MNTAWVLILAFWPGSNSGTAITIENLASLDECTAMLVPVDTYHKLMEAIASVKSGE